MIKFKHLLQINLLVYRQSKQRNVIEDQSVEKNLMAYPNGYCCGHDHIVVGFTTTYATSVYDH